jgi:hypothetical protein
LVDNDSSNSGDTGTATITETNRTNLAPGFVTPGSDYHLMATSPLIDIGDPAPPPPLETDIDGDPREIFGKNSCDGPRRDIGADEFVPATPPTLLDCSTPASPGVVDASSPDTSIAGRRKVRTRKKKARVTFTLTSTEPGSSFECSLDSKPFIPCVSPFSTKLRLGKHLLTVRSRDAAGNVDATPAAIPVKVKRKL